MTRNKIALWCAFTGLSAVWAGCGDDALETHDSPTSAPTGAPDATKLGGVVKGVVRLAEGATLPSYAQKDMERGILQHTKRGEWPKSCTPPKEADKQPVKLTGDGLLAGVMVAGSNFKGAKPRPPKTFEVAIRDCRLDPALVVAMKGDRIVIKNEVDFPFMPTTGTEKVARTLMPGQQFDVPLDRGGLQAILCGFTAPCGRTDVIAVYHPVFAVTDEQGRFSLPDFPTDQKVQLNAWHPLFAEAHIEVQVGQGETKEVVLTLTPADASPKVDAGVAP